MIILVLVFTLLGYPVLRQQLKTRLL